MEPESLEWHYLDPRGQEFGPFPAHRMAAWFRQGFFPIGDKLLVRAKEWRKHVAVNELWPRGGSEPFAGPFRDPARHARPDRAQAPPGGHPAAGGPQYGHGPPPMPFGYPPPVGYGAPPMPFGYPPVAPYGFPPPFLPLPPATFGAHGSPGPAERGRWSRSRSPRGRGRGGDARRPFEPHHAGVPKSTDLAGKFAEHSGPPTTGMLRNIPNKYLQDDILEEIDAVGFGGAYDFFYLPMDIKNGANVGYAFVNFISADAFERFRDAFDGYQFKRAGSRKVAAVCPATVQGLKANVQNLLKKRVAQGEYRPLVLRGGRRVELDDIADDL